jgi:hypothetical protein
VKLNGENTMLKLRKDFVGLALTATLMVGCQTAKIAQNPEDYSAQFVNVDMNQIFPEYVYDNGRTPAGDLSPFIRIIREMETAAKTAIETGVKSSEFRGVSADEFRTFVKSSKDEQIFKAQRQAFDKLSPAEKKTVGSWKNVDLNDSQLGELPANYQALQISKFVRMKNIESAPTLSKIMNDVDSRLASAEGLDLLTFRKKITDRILSDRAHFDGTASAESAAKFRKEAAENFVAEKARSGIGAAYADLEHLLVAAAHGETEASAIRAAMLDVRLAAGETRDLSGLFNLTAKTRENLDTESLPRLSALYRKIRDRFARYSKSRYETVMITDLKTGERRAVQVRRWERIPCHNVAEIAAYAAVKFEEELGRLEIAALASGSELTTCGYIAEETKVGFDDLAKKAPDGKVREPACE